MANKEVATIPSTTEENLSFVITEEIAKGNGTTVRIAAQTVNGQRTSSTSITMSPQDALALGEALVEKFGKK